MAALRHTVLSCADVMDFEGPGSAEQPDAHPQPAADHPAARACLDLRPSSETAYAQAPGHDGTLGASAPLATAPSMAVEATSGSVLADFTPPTPGAAHAAADAARGDNIDLRPHGAAPGMTGAQVGVAGECGAGDESMLGSSEEDDEVPGGTLGAAATQEVAQQVRLPCSAALRIHGPQVCLPKQGIRSAVGVHVLVAVLRGMMYWRSSNR